MGWLNVYLPSRLMALRKIWLKFGYVLVHNKIYLFQIWKIVSSDFEKYDLKFNKECSEFIIICQKTPTDFEKKNDIMSRKK